METKKNYKCKAPPCTSSFTCGQKKETQGAFWRNKEKETRTQGNHPWNWKSKHGGKNLEAFQSKSILAFATAVTQRLLKAFRDKYSPRTLGGKVALQKDIATLQIACNNKIPSVSDNERNMFLTLLEKQRSAQEMNPVSVIQLSNCNDSSASTTLSKVHSKLLTVNQFAISRIRDTVRQKDRRSRSNSSESSSEGSSSNSSTDHKRKHCKKKRRRKLVKKKKSQHKKKRCKSSSSRSSSLDGRTGALVDSSLLLCRSS